MSYKDGIPLLASFEDDVDDDDLTFETVRPRGRCRCSKRTFLFSVVLGLAVGLVIALIVGVSVPLVLVDSSRANTGSGIQHISSTTDSGGLLSSVMVPTTTAQTGTNSATTGQSGLTSVTSSQSGLPSSMAVSSSSRTALPSTVSTVLQPSLTLSASVSQRVASTASPAQIPSASLSPSSAAPNASPLPTSSVGQQINPVSTPSLALYSSLQSTLISTSFAVSPAVSVDIVNTLSVFLQPTPTIASPVASPTPTVTPPTPTDDNCTMDDVVCHSKLDDRDYKVTTLENNLRVLLISDPNSNISAAAMDIPAGSFNDPKDYEGLAHFCEHMLFIGTGKYPKLNQYSNFLQTHGGYDNAYTSTQNTNYYFNVEADYFSNALDMFAHFFIDPLFSESSVMDEMNAVNAEHEKNLQSDSWKLWQLLKHVSNPAHPFSQFSTGSLETLNKSGVLSQLLRYYNSSYSANTVSCFLCCMAGCVSICMQGSNKDLFGRTHNSHLDYNYSLPIKTHIHVVHCCVAIRRT